ncbi:thioesterase family protein [Streptomyces sp. RPT161]|uniref:thioesterase family protein n=1 Tax=Streptomyces sp. RPT161 TaxID=3015993 RepID=UPI0022B85AF7|nr:thioesterase family protein [Streptomyces sp. RPT161]
MTSAVTAGSTVESADGGPLFVPRGVEFVPAPHATGPWDAGRLHGAAVALLVTQYARRGIDARRALARLTVDFLRPVPAEPLRVAVSPLRTGRSFDVVDALVTADGTAVARGSLVYLRATRRPTLPDGPPDDPPPPPHTGVRLRDTGGTVSFNRDAVELRLVDDASDTAWVRLCCPVLPDAAVLPEQLAVAAAEFCYGTGSTLPPDLYSCVNVDLSVHLHRPPTGRWIALRAVTRTGPTGGGAAHAALLDGAGRIGSAVQTLLVSEA